MNKVRIVVLLLLALLFTSCFSIPGYVSEDGSITPPYSKVILIEAVSESVSVSPVETSKGISNRNPSKSDSLRSKKQSSIFLNEGNRNYYTLEGNHSVVLAFRTLAKEAKFKITYKNENYIKDQNINKDIFSKLGKNQIILFEGHGSFETIPGDPEMHSVMWTGASYDESKKETDEDYKNNRLIGAGALGYEEALDSYFVEEHVGDITGSIVYLGNCYSAREVTFAQSFLKKGAVAVIGNSHTTQSAYNSLMTYSTITNLIQNNPETNKPYTLLEALNKGKSLYGKNDQEKKNEIIAKQPESFEGLLILDNDEPKKACI